MTAIFPGSDKRPAILSSLMAVLGVLLFSGYFFVPPAFAFVEHIELCNGDEKPVTCVFDGDTIWLHGEEVQLTSHDAPEVEPALACGGQEEIALGREAAQRLVDILNHELWAVKRLGKDETGSRTLAVIIVAQQDIAEHMIEDGFARPLPNGEKFWCKS